MQPDRFIRAKDDDLFFHYCTAEAFLQICKNKTIRFSDIYTMNDSMEMRWGYKLWEEFASAEVEGEPNWPALRSKVSEYLEFLVPLTSCYSTQGDILSQWRAYAADGTGFCIGFNGRFCKSLPASSLQVEYGLDNQRIELAELTRRALQLGADTTEFAEAASDLVYNLFGYKNSAFVEESELRMIHGAARRPDNSIQSIGGFAMDEEIPPAEMHFQMRNSTPSPYVDLSFAQAVDPISEVLLGPKNYAEPESITRFLATMGLQNVAVRRSVASYR